jgi:hypothetical protein
MKQGAAKCHRSIVKWGLVVIIEHMEKGTKKKQSVGVVTSRNISRQLCWNIKHAWHNTLLIWFFLWYHFGSIAHTMWYQAMIIPISYSTIVFSYIHLQIQPLCVCQGLLISRVSDADTLISTNYTEGNGQSVMKNEQIHIGTCQIPSLLNQEQKGLNPSFSSGDTMSSWNQVS